MDCAPCLLQMIFRCYRFCIYWLCGFVLCWLHGVDVARREIYILIIMNIQFKVGNQTQLALRG